MVFLPTIYHAVAGAQEHRELRLRLEQVRNLTAVGLESERFDRNLTETDLKTQELQGATRQVGALSCVARHVFGPFWRRSVGAMRWRYAHLYDR